MMEKDQSNEQQEIRKQSIYNENIVEIPTVKSVLLSKYSLTYVTNFEFIQIGDSGLQMEGIPKLK